MTTLKSITALFVLAVILLTACNKSDNSNNPVTSSIERGYNDQYIIVFKSDKSNSIQSASDCKAQALNLFNSNGISDAALLDVYSDVVVGFSAKLSQSEAEILAQDPSVEYVEPDRLFKLPEESVVVNTNSKSATTQAQSVPWGVSYVGGTSSANYTGNKVAWIVDTGIDFTHEDLNVNLSLSKSFVTSGTDATTADDFNGHGSHCAGIIAAKNNSVGVIGVAPGATVVAVKVLNSDGCGATSAIINGLNYVKSKAKAGDVINLSLGGSASVTLDNAAIACANAGIYVCVAAGNSKKNANNYSPSRANATNLYTISSHNSTGKFSTFSNYGNPPVDYSAPGEYIVSTYKDGQYATMSGTSMATPHVAGILLKNNGVINYNGVVYSDLDSNPDKKAHL